MVDSRPRVVLITGCSVGSLGAALAEEFASRGCRVFATARSSTKMKGLSSGIQQIQLDVLSDESVEKAVQTIIDKEGRIDCLVNSAGANRIGALLDVPLKDVEQLFQTNVFATLRLTKVVVPYMAAQKSGLVINIGSIAGNQSSPWYGPYSASKSALHSLSDTLDMELRPLGVHVLLLAIGMVRSNISANVEAAHDFRPANSYYDAYRRNIDARLGQGDDVMPADLFARKTVDAALAPAPPRYMSFGGQVGLFTQVFAWLPRSIRLDLAWKAYSAVEPKV